MKQKVDHDGQYPGMMQSFAKERIDRFIIDAPLLNLPKMI
jgi:hypothetical protein